MVTNDSQVNSTFTVRKWRLGDQPEFLPTRHGFDQYFGIPYSNDMWPHHSYAGHYKNGCCPLPVLRDGKVVDMVEDMADQGELCQRFTDEAVAFIRENRDRPFFVYLPYAFVHHPRSARDAFIKRAGPADALDEKKMLGNPIGYATRQRTRAQIEEGDWSVGRILDALRELGIEKNTLVNKNWKPLNYGGARNPMSRAWLMKGICDQ